MSIVIFTFCFLRLAFVTICLPSPAKKPRPLEHLLGAKGQRADFERAGRFPDEKLRMWREFTGPRHPERIALYQEMFHYFDQFLAEYESRYEKEYSYLQPFIKAVVER